MNPRMFRLAFSPEFAARPAIDGAFLGVAPASVVLVDRSKLKPASPAFSSSIHELLPSRVAKDVYFRCQSQMFRCDRSELSDGSCKTSDRASDRPASLGTISVVRVVMTQLAKFE